MKYLSLALQIVLIVVVAIAFAVCFALVAAASWADDRIEEINRKHEKSPD